MKAQDARAIIRENKLIERKISKTVLNSITLNRAVDPVITEDSRIQQIIPEIKRDYWRIRSALPAEAPRNLPFYVLIQNKYPDFEWHKNDGGMEIDYQFAGIRPSLLSLLAGVVPAGTPSQKADSLAALSLLPPGIAPRIRSMITEAGFVTPTVQNIESFTTWLLKGLAGEPLTLISPVCPDYEIIDGTKARHRFTFGGVGSGIGVTCTRLFEALPLIHRCLRDDLRLNVRHWVCPGDFEGFSADTNARMNIDEATFLRRLDQTRQAILTQAPAPVDACFFTDFCGGKAAWMALYSETLARLRAGEYGPVAGTDWLRQIAQARRSLYDRWYDVSNRTDDFYDELALRQGAEYAAMGRIIESHADLPNPLVIGADDHKMSGFYRLAAQTPVLYLKRIYE